MPAGRPPLDPEIKHQHRQESLKRYAAKNADVLRGKAKARMSVVRAKIAEMDWKEKKLHRTRVAEDSERYGDRQDQKERKKRKSREAVKTNKRHVERSILREAHGLPPLPQDPNGPRAPRPGEAIQNPRRERAPRSDTGMKGWKAFHRPQPPTTLPGPNHNDAHTTLDNLSTRRAATPPIYEGGLTASTRADYCAVVAQPLRFLRPQFPYSSPKYQNMVSTRKKTYASVAETTRTPQKSILQEVAEVGASFNGQNEPAVLAAEGELQFGSLPPVDQHALRVAQGPRIHGSDLDELVATYENQDADDDEEERDESPTAGDSESGADAASSENVEDESAYILHSQGSLDWESSENGFVVPRITAKKYKWLVPERMDTKYKFFPTWFDLSEDEDQLGPIPGSWVKKEEVDFQSAIEASIEEVKISSAVPARSMAVIVEVPEEAAAKQSTKGKNVDAAERSTGFAAYLQEMQNSNAAREKHHKKSKDAKKAKERFSRSESQVPEGGWFRATTSKSGSPPAPPNTPSSSSDSSSSSDTSSSESAQSDQVLTPVPPALTAEFAAGSCETSLETSANWMK
ncbi:hypothetical protein B0H14DRAFT_2579228 [Mycena olivaceomarginata]|nr:hypothetical protein B0H14DRAFT_2579228 [Mycena olivaceomarginata]